MRFFHFVYIPRAFFRRPSSHPSSPDLYPLHFLFHFFLADYIPFRRCPSLPSSLSAVHAGEHRCELLSRATVERHNSLLRYFGAPNDIIVPLGPFSARIGGNEKKHGRNPSNSYRFFNRKKDINREIGSCVPISTASINTPNFFHLFPHDMIRGCDN